MEKKVGIVSEKLDLNRLVEDIIRETTNLGGGALVLFIGYVKGKIGDSIVSELNYEAYEDYALTKMYEIIQEEKKERDVLDIRIFHRVGTLKPGDITIYVAVSALNRKIAFEVASKVLERVKHEVPIFKLEKRSDGEYWVFGDGKRVPRDIAKSRTS